MKQFDLFGGFEEIKEETFEEKYKRVLSSKRWKDLKNLIIEMYGNKCMVCGISGYSKKLELHHYDYENLGKETEEDVALLCPDCHGVSDIEREMYNYAEGKVKRFQALFRKAWITRVENLEEEKQRELNDYEWEYERKSFRHYLFCRFFDMRLWGELPKELTADYIMELWGY